MILYVLCSYGDGLYSPIVSTNYDNLYQKMYTSYHCLIDNLPQTEEERQNTYLSNTHARAVIYDNWLEWSITKIEL